MPAAIAVWMLPWPPVVTARSTWGITRWLGRTPSTMILVGGQVLEVVDGAGDQDPDVEAARATRPPRGPTRVESRSSRRRRSGPGGRGTSAPGRAAGGPGARRAGRRRRDGSSGGSPCRGRQAARSSAEMPSTSGISGTSDRSPRSRAARLGTSSTPSDAATRLKPPQYPVVRLVVRLIRKRLNQSGARSGVGRPDDSAPGATFARRPAGRNFPRAR